MPWFLNKEQHPQEPRKLLVLLIDDSPGDIELYKHYLAKSPDYECEFMEAPNATLALMMLEQNMPDCILLDYRLPDQNGLYLLSKINEKFPNHPPVVFITGYPDETIKQKVLGMGAGAFLDKAHLEVNGLKSALEKSLHKKAA